MSANARFVHVMSRVSPLPDWMSTQRRFNGNVDSSPMISHAKGHGKTRFEPQTYDAAANKHVVRDDVHPPSRGYSSNTWLTSYTRNARNMVFVGSMAAAPAAHSLVEP